MNGLRTMDTAIPQGGLPMGSISTAVNGNNRVLATQSCSSLSEATGYVSRIRAWHIVLLMTLALTLVTAAECHSITSLPSLRYGFVLSGWWGTIALVVWRLGQWRPRYLQIQPTVLLAHLGVATVLGVLHLLLMSAVDFISLTASRQAQIGLTWHYYLQLNRWGLEMLVYGFIFGVAAVMDLHLKAQRSALQAVELQRELSAAQLHALQMQVEPHFLFNTLNAITTLVEMGQQQQAAEMLKHLNVILKTTLRRSAPEKIPLAEELDAVENYLAIEQIRFADRLRLEFRIDPSALNALVPSFLLQPLMENAIRHGISKLEDGGMIQTSVEKQDGTLLLRIQDNGPAAGPQAVQGHGIGLKNLTTRLRHFYPERHSFQVTKPETGGFQVRIAIPYETAEV
jgi:signal transduction histidine kinase